MNDFFIVGLVVLVLVLPFVGFVFMAITTSLYWSRGKISPFYRKSTEHIAEMQVALAVNLLLADRSERNEKLQFFSLHFFRYFPEFIELNLTIQNFQNEPVRTTEASKWLHRCLSSDEKRELLNVLVQLASIDGRVGQKEYRVLSEVAFQFELPVQQIDVLIAGLESERIEKESQIANELDPQLKNALELFGLQLPIDLELLKRRYYKLVKLVHPDYFPKASDSEKKIYTEKFQELQVSYDYLLNYSSSK